MSCKIDSVGTKRYIVNGLLHREDGPAIEFADGDKKWFLNGVEIDCKSNEEFLRIVKQKTSISQKEEKK